MNKYEVLYIINTTIDDAAKDAECERMANCVTECGGSVESVNKWGVRRLAYPINFRNDGYYVLMTFTSNADVPSELERRMKISENVVRYMVTKLIA